MERAVGPHDQVFVPSSWMVPGDDEVTLELRRLVDGRLALVAFTSVESLVGGCGAGQPWVGMARERLDWALVGAGVDVVFWDESLPPDQQRHRLPGGTV